MFAISPKYVAKLGTINAGSLCGVTLYRMHIWKKSPPPLVPREEPGGRNRGSQQQVFQLIYLLRGMFLVIL